VPYHTWQDRPLGTPGRDEAEVRWLQPGEFFANCIDGQEQAANDRIARALEDDGV
jgi:hypothetical protein